ncbi:acyl-CoA dehydrogenase C-terminal domain-containing protein [Thioalbus denitrificans]|uniref:3-methylmercaptopropionyl-CoA dehydrogenase n=1 Tax=Thioalbus denitrificans TaxID=547122 RepID=A0A369CGH1_9GAMM|nr:acyl-CoA dehydrogenase C-terminal domain-containing protein [Thioalbus denitrificans]RCX32348.1 alkylation response protein AidB-like acyl-CoA dehydrogenase [Thioalbus denitrificans]
MPTYRAPLRDMRFVYTELLEADRRLTALEPFAEASADLVEAVLEEGAKVCEGVLFPLNQAGDVEGCRLEEGAVRTPAGFPEAYRTWCGGGWTGLACDPDYGGQGLPETLGFMVEEMLCSANVSFSLYPGLTRGAYHALRAHGPEALRRLYLPRLVSGEWSGTMCLTEPHAGTDLGLLRTRAEPAEDGAWRITGTKIFITSGEHDLAENIVHLVLARLPDAPPGIKGLSLFLVPKFLPDGDGNPGERNAVACGALEHKMGIRASSTCVMNFDGATGWLVGEPHKGVACMFTMMNTERLAIGIQGLGLAEVAYQNAAAYARERLQSRALSGPRQPEQAADSILVHPDVRRMLLTARACNEGARALAGWTAMQIDLSRHHPEPEAREAAEDLVALVTPVVKAFFTDYGFEAANHCLQVLGGHGYIREWGMEQYVRDARIASIYEGTNGIQALDLVRRKLYLHDGRLPERLFALMEETVSAHLEEAALAEFVGPLAAEVARLRALTDWLRTRAGENPEELGAAAVDYLRLTALTILAWLWTRMAAVAVNKQDGEEGGFYRAKLATGRFYMQRILPQNLALDAAIRAGAAPLMAHDESWF